MSENKLGAAIGTGILAQETGQVVPSTLVYNTTGRYDPNTFTYNGSTVSDNITISNTSAVNHVVVFHGPNGKEVGRMDFNGEQLEFEGNASEAAKVFTEWCRRTWSDLRDKDRVEVLDAVIHDIIAESSGELYSEEEKVAMLTCLQIVQGQKNTYVAPQVAQNIAKQAPLTPAGVQAQAMAALAPEGKSL